LQYDSISRWVALGAAICSACGTAREPEPTAVSTARVLTFTETELVPSDGAPGLEIESVAYDGATAIVGATTADSFSSGYAYLYAREGALFTETTKLTAGAQFFSNSFGDNAAVHGDQAVVSAYSSAFALEKNGSSWSVVAELTPVISVGGIGGLAIHGDTLAIAKQTFGGEDGEVFVYRRGASGWQPEATLTTAHDPSPTLYFGAPIALVGDVLIAGAPAGYNPVFSLGGETPGAVYVFRRDGSGWQPTQKLLPSDTAPEDLFGASLAYDGTTLVVGAPGADAAGADRGAVYVFTDTGSAFAETARIEAFSANDDSNGYRVAVSGDRIANVSYRGGSPGFLSISEKGPDNAWEPALVIQPSIDTVSLGHTLAFVESTIVANGEGHAWAFTLKGEGVCTPDGGSVDLGGGKLESCAPYLCVAGSCRSACTVSAECAAGLVCDREQGQGTCVAPGGVSDEAGGCALGARERRGSSLALVAAVALMVWLRRKKSTLA
jgi:hypothetical protein